MTPNDPQRLAAWLSQADRFHGRQVAVGRALRTVKYGLLALCLVTVADVLWHLPPRARIGLLALWFLGLLTAAGMLIVLAVYRRRHEERTARLIEAREPALGSALINTLQLSRQLAGELPALTRALAQRAVSDNLRRLTAFDYRPILKLTELRRYARQALLAVAVFAVIALAAWPVTRVELWRYLDPFGDHPPYSWTQLSISEPAADGTEVVFGQDLIVRAASVGHRPAELFLSYHAAGADANVQTLPMFDLGAGGFSQQIENVERDLTVWVHTADGRARSHRRAVTVVLTPQLAAASLTIAPPAYTGLPERHSKFRFNTVQALFGSRLTFSLASNRPLASGQLLFAPADGGQREHEMRPVASHEVAAELVAARPGRLSFALVDVAGVRSQEQLRGALKLTYDQPPQVSIPVPGSDAYVTEDFRLEVQVAASDDYGVRRLRLHRSLNQVYSAPLVFEYDELVTRVSEVIPFDIARLGVEPGDVITLYAEVTDTCPEPHIVASDPVQLMVISVAEYNRMLREQQDIADIQAKYEALHRELQDLLAAQRALRDDIGKVQEQLAAADGHDAEALQQELDSLLARQSELDQKLVKLADKMDSMVRETPLYDIERELQRVLSQVAAKLRESAAENRDAVAAFAKQSDAGKQSKKQLLAGLKTLHEAASRQLDKIEGGRRKVNDEVLETLADLTLLQQLIADFNAFRDLYLVQQSIVTQAKPYNTLRMLSGVDRLALNQVGGEERRLGKLLQELVARLRDHGYEAQSVFPKAAKSALDLAADMEQAELGRLARRAANLMLIPDGLAAYDAAERLRREMSKFFQDKNCQGMCNACNSLDSYLRLWRNFLPGSTFAQMQQSRKYGMSMGFGPGAGMGYGGGTGTTVARVPAIGVLGNESMLTTAADQRPDAATGRGLFANAAAAADEIGYDKVDVLSAASTVSRRSAAVDTAAPPAQYRDLVDKYFEVISK